MKHDKFITTNKHLKIKSASRADLFGHVYLVTLFVDASSVVCPPQMSPLAQAVNGAAFLEMSLLDPGAPLKIGDRSRAT